MSIYDGYSQVHTSHNDYETDVVRERQQARERETRRLTQAALEDRVERLEERVRCQALDIKSLEDQVRQMAERLMSAERAE